MLRFGALGAARITPTALIEPAGDHADVVVTAVAARERSRAAAFAAAHDIEHVVDGYGQLVRSPEIDAVYNALPPSEHLRWTVAALEAGKHVLCEKPIAANAGEAAIMVDAARSADRVLCEAFHWRYHPLADRVLELVGSGAIGRVEHLDAVFNAGISDRTDIRHSFALGGGALMDLGCYPVHWVRTVMGTEPTVISAHCEVGEPRVDVRTTAELEFPGGVTATVRTAMEGHEPVARLIVEGDEGRIEVDNPMAPHRGHQLRVRRRTGDRVEQVDGRSTYSHQLEAFHRAVTSGWPLPTSGSDPVRNMAVIDAIYRAAGLPLRGT